MLQISLRMPDWSRRLDVLVCDRLARPFAWGSNDCCAWGADVAQALRGHDLLWELRVPREGVFSALRQIRQRGGIPAALARAGLEAIAPQRARRGDLVLIDQGTWPVLATCNGGDALAPGADGLAVCPMTRALGAWQL